MSPALSKTPSVCSEDPNISFIQQIGRVPVRTRKSSNICICARPLFLHDRAELRPVVMRAPAQSIGRCSWRLPRGRRMGPGHGVRLIHTNFA